MLRAVGFYTASHLDILVEGMSCGNVKVTDYF
jgi:hypothetical protein